ncbi:hypothetical protein [Acanthopleuribacter pedis]|uniref:Secreted protein n=1 Tax=Acanthopleuribacter pedis TaxID=442870 RepID=A0A8J7QAX6_9BACT|nr:hypothetical protein [Acanthopleuribacter pedis]MBO1322126.1 hypothetical protein [Acanthopleuribacter pedis]
MKHRTLLCLLIAALISVVATVQAGRIEVASTEVGDYTRPTGKRAQVLKVVPHMAINDSWRSAVMVRNNANRTIAITMDLLNSDGNLAQASIFDGANENFRGSSFNLNLSPFEIIVLEFDQILTGEANLQAFFYSEDFDSEYSIETTYSSFEGQTKNATVGVFTDAPGPNFLINVDQRIDSYSERRKFRGMALTNTSNESCDCRVSLFDAGLNGQNFQPLVTINLNSIPSGGKFLGITYDLFPSIDQLLGQSPYGYLEFVCTQNVSALALAFENGTQISSSIPVDYFSFAQTKDGETVRKFRK